MNLLEHLQIKTLELSPEKVVLALDIHAIHLQPYGYLHGGINGVLIETACSLGANQHLEEPHFAVGVDLQVNHLNKAQTGTLTVIAAPDKVGRSLQVWQAEIFLDQQIKTAVGRCTLAVQ
ncbi:PaaI family thioesterase [Enterococcus sp. DIV0660C]|uniref:PaaI family thioesterase n=1 Tax=Enterococcus sp. DIV0660C TaxID=2230880 RepID=UPI001A8D2418|nr:PaaI family thioesterase [Enterococcus sp. DIV0660C]MBO0431227.1 PaaI family thioesterase [Enterococcus sp. DIV0660C]